MKYAIVAIVFALAGFASGYLMTMSGRPASRLTPTVNSDPAPAIVSSTNVTPQPVQSMPTVDIDSIRHQTTVFDKLYTAWQISAAASPDQLASLLEQIIDTGDPLYSRNIAAIFLERWVAIDPGGALDFVTHHLQMDQEFFQGHVITSWVRYDPEAAIDSFMNIEDRQVRFAVGARLLDDPTLANTGLLAEVEDVLGPAAESLAQRMRLRHLPADEAFEKALALDGREATLALISSAVRWSFADPDGVMQRIAALPDQTRRQMLMRSVLTQIARSDGNRALELLDLYAPGDTRLTRTVLQTFASADPVQALSRVERYTDRTGKTGVLSMLMASWVRSDPNAALNYALTLPPDRQRKIYRSMGTSYMKARPGEALNWALSLGSEFDDVKKMMLSAMSSRNTALAEKNLDRVQDPQLRSVMVQQIARSRSQRNVDDALSWIARNTSPQSKVWQLAMSTVAGQLASRGDAERSLEIIDRLPPGNVKTSTRFSVAWAWSRRKPEQVEEIISALDLSPAFADRLRKQSESFHGNGRYYRELSLEKMD